MTESKPVGTVIRIDGDWAKKLKGLQDKLDSLRQDIGAIRETYLETEAKLIAELSPLKMTFNLTVMKVASIHGADTARGSGEEWRYDPSTLTFTRTA